MRRIISLTDGSHDGDAAPHRRNGRHHHERPSENGSSGRPAAAGKRALVTGGAGFIGTNVTAQLAGDGYEVEVFDNLSRPGVERNWEWLRDTFGTQVRLHRHDIRDSGAVRRVLEGVDVVFHFAAQVAVTTSLVDPLTDFETNARGTFNVLDACRRQELPPRLLFTSTNKVYGNLEHVGLSCEGDRCVPLNHHIRDHGVSEDCPLDFHSPYGCSKGTADQYVLDFARCYGLPAVVFRMSCIYGPHQFGTEDQGWVAHFVRQTLHGKPLTFYGDGRQVRDILFVEDLVRAMMLAVEQMDVTRGQAFNMGGGPTNAVSLLELVDLIGRLHRTGPEISFSPWRQGDQRYYVSDTGRFREATGWKPQVGVEQGVGRLYEWLVRNEYRMPAAVTN